MDDIQVDRAAVVVMWNGKYNMDECCSRDLNWYQCADVKTFPQQACDELNIDKDGFITSGTAGKAYKYQGRQVKSVVDGDGGRTWTPSSGDFDKWRPSTACTVNFEGLTKVLVYPDHEQYQYVDCFFNTGN